MQKNIKDYLIIVGIVFNGCYSWAKQCPSNDVGMAAARPSSHCRMDWWRTDDIKEHQLCQGGQCSRGTTQAARLFALFLVQREATNLSGRATVMSRQRRQRVTAQRGSSVGRRRRRAALTQRIRNIGTTLATFLDAQFLIFVFFSFLETDIELKKSYLNNIIFGSQVV